MHHLKYFLFFPLILKIIKLLKSVRVNLVDIPCLCSLSVTHDEEFEKNNTRTPFPRLHVSLSAGRQQQQRRIPPPPSSNRAADVSKGLPRHTHPLINNTTFNFPASPRTPKRPFSGPTGANVSPTGQIKRPFSNDSARQHLRAPSRLSVSSAIITMRQAAWQRCGMKKTQWRRLRGASEARGNTLKTVATSSGGRFRQHSHIFTSQARENSAP